MKQLEKEVIELKENLRVLVKYQNDTRLYYNGNKLIYNPNKY